MNTLGILSIGAAALPSRFKTPGPGTYRPPSDFGYIELTKEGKQKDKLKKEMLSTAMTNWQTSQIQKSSQDVSVYNSVVSKRRHSQFVKKLPFGINNTSEDSPI